MQQKSLKRKKPKTQTQSLNSVMQFETVGGVVEVTVGHDAEVFLADQDGQIVPSCGLLGGTKDKPRPVEGGYILEDNVTAELNIDPCNTEEQFVTRTITTMKSLLALLPPDFTLQLLSMHKFPKKQLNHPSAMEFGCDPDFNFYTLEPNEYQIGKWIEQGVRFAGGHVHIGVRYVHTDQAHPIFDSPNGFRALCYAAELHIGTMLWDLSPTATLRHETYGRAGCYRMKPYGVEYRSPPNLWLQNNATMGLVFKAAVVAAITAVTQPESFLDSISGLGSRPILNAYTADSGWRHEVSTIRIRNADKVWSKQLRTAA